jgi:sporulation protein YlmC with PRC-barrel domain
MSSKAFFGGAAFVVAAAITAGSFVAAQDNAQPAAAAQAAPDGQPAAKEVPHYRAKQILGAKVGLQGSSSVGTVDDIVLDANGNVDYLIVMTDDNKLVTVPWDATQFNVEKRTAVVQIPQEQFQKIPTYTAERYPAFASPAYRTQVYTYYGLRPGQERRAIRRGAVVVP